MSKLTPAKSSASVRVGHVQTSAVFALAAIAERRDDASFRLGPGLVQALLQDIQPRRSRN